MDAPIYIGKINVLSIKIEIKYNGNVGKIFI